MDIKGKVGQRIKQLRTERKLSQESIAYTADMERSFMTHIENGRRNISIETLERIITAFDISFKDFFDSKIFIAQAESR
jgi:transcriptional regulator with XRE-family HTH domain